MTLIRLAGVDTKISGTLKGGGLLLDTCAVCSKGDPLLSVKESATNLTCWQRAALGA